VKDTLYKLVENHAAPHSWVLRG